MKDYQNVEEGVLWSDFRNGEKYAYEFMYRKFAPVLYNYGYKITLNRALTQDCIQDLFLTLLNNKAKLGPTTSIKFYLYKSLRRDLMRAIRSEQRFVNQYDQGDYDFNVVFSYESVLIEEQMSAERSESLNRALQNLPPRQKEVIFLRFYENLSFEEIAEVMAIEQSSVYKIIYKAIDNLHGKLLVEYAIVLIQLHFLSKI